MKFFIVFAAILASSMASLYHSHLLAAPAVAVPAAVPVATAWSAAVPSSRFTRTDWVQPGLLHTIPAVAQYHSITPAHVSLAPAAAPLLHLAAPAVAHAPLVQHLIKK